MLGAAIATFLAMVINGDYRPQLHPRGRASFVRLPSYSHAAVITGSAIILAVCLIVLLALAAAWWRRRRRWR